MLNQFKHIHDDDDYDDYTFLSRICTQKAATTYMPVPMLFDHVQTKGQESQIHILSQGHPRTVIGCIKNLQKKRKIRNPNANPPRKNQRAHPPARYGPRAEWRTLYSNQSRLPAAVQRRHEPSHFHNVRLVGSGLASSGRDSRDSHKTMSNSIS